MVMERLYSFQRLKVPIEMEECIKQVLNKINRLNSNTLKIVFCGSFKTGKSSLINCIIGREVLPTKITSATGVTTKIFYSDTPTAYIITDEDVPKIKYIPFKEVQNYILIEDKNLLRIKTKPVKVIGIGINNYLLKKGVCLIDTPGLGDDESLDKITMEQVEESDISIMVLTANQLFSQSDRYCIKQFNEQLGGNLIFDINRMDELDNPSDIKDIEVAASKRLLTVSNRLIGEPKIFFTSAAKKNCSISSLLSFIEKMIFSDSQTALEKIKLNARLSSIKKSIENILIQAENNKENCISKYNFLSFQHEDSLIDDELYLLNEDIHQYNLLIECCEDCMREIESELRVLVYDNNNLNKGE